MQKFMKMGIGDWPNPQSPIPNPQSPIPNPQSPITLEKYVKTQMLFSY